MIETFHFGFRGRGKCDASSSVIRVSHVPGAFGGPRVRASTLRERALRLAAASAAQILEPEPAQHPRQP